MGIGEHVGENVGERTGTSGAKRSASGTSGAPATYTRWLTFENGTLGNAAYTANSDDDNFDFITTAGRCTVSNTQVFQGTQSAKLTLPISSGDGLGGSTGLARLDQAGFEEGLTLVTGDEIWYQFRIFCTATYFSEGGLSTTGGPKGPRFRTKNDPSVWNTWYPKPQGNPNWPSGVDSYWWSLGDGTAIPPATNVGVACSGNGGTIPVQDQWETFEFYIKVGHASSRGKLRCWRNHYPCELYEMISYYTFGSATWEATYDTIRDDGTDYLRGSMSFFPTWNNGATTDEIVMYVDSIVTCVNKADLSIQDTPAKTDSNGFKFIGNWEDD